MTDDTATLADLAHRRAGGVPPEGLRSRIVDAASGLGGGEDE